MGLDVIKAGFEGFFVDPVIGVEDLEIGTIRHRKGGVNGSAVAFILLVDGLKDSRVFGFVFLSDLKRAVFGAVIDDEDLDVLAAD
jgi:hypothetical protein